MRSTAIVGMLVVLVASCGQQPAAVQKPEGGTDIPTHTSYAITVRFTDSSHTKARLSATVGRVWEGRQETTVQGNVVVDFYSKTSGRRIARLTADSAHIDDRTKMMRAIGNVIVVSDSSQTTLSTPSMLWDSHRERLSSTEAVRIVTPNESIDGIGFESDQALTDYRIFKVRGAQH
ncbi:MAG: LPS export ABC transporter periplasmic protein LptC [Candidatus Kapabacteria bacterium]|nr:LPS export ABC transporter periplasmic protein LptC [Candidatus Kapabacteria bacterium]